MLIKDFYFDILYWCSFFFKRIYILFILHLDQQFPLPPHSPFPPPLPSVPTSQSTPPFLLRKGSSPMSINRTLHIKLVR